MEEQTVNIPSMLQTACRFPSDFIIIKDWSQFLSGSWRNNLNQVVHKGVYNLIEVISNKPNK
jgi:hypothetical protein